jgi:hypothetical protein
MSTDNIPERRKSPDENARILVGIKAVITSYYLDLDARKHGGVAMNRALNKIEQILGMSWHEHQVAMREATQLNPTKKALDLHNMFQDSLHPKNK